VSSEEVSFTLELSELYNPKFRAESIDARKQ